MRQGKDDKTTEAQYEEIVAKVCDNRIAADRLDKSYLDRFKKILSNKKIFLVQRAEMRFHREMLKGMNRKDGGNDPKRKKINRRLCLDEIGRSVRVNQRLYPHRIGASDFLFPGCIFVALLKE